MGRREDLNLTLFMPIIVIGAAGYLATLKVTLPLTVCGLLVTVFTALTWVR